MTKKEALQKIREWAFIHAYPEIEDIVDEALATEANVTDKGFVSLANVSGALVDSGVVVPEDETQYGEAIRELKARADALQRDLDQELSAHRQTIAERDLLGSNLRQADLDIDTERKRAIAVERRYSELAAEYHTVRRALVAASQVMPGGDPVAVIYGQCVHVNRAVPDAIRTTRESTAPDSVMSKSVAKRHRALGCNDLNCECHAVIGKAWRKTKP